MSKVFFEDLGLPSPAHFLGVGSSAQGAQTGAALKAVETVLLEPSNRPNAVVVVGDTNTTLAGSLAAIKLGIPVVHVEAGVRSFDFSMTEEINRRAVDAVATVCFAPTERALRQLHLEGRGDAAVYSGDTLVETTLASLERALASAAPLDRLGLLPQKYNLATLHRSENVDQPDTLRELVGALIEIPGPTVFPVHPRTRRMLDDFGLRTDLEKAVQLVEPLSYYDFLSLIARARLVLTDSGGVQQEAAILNVPAITPRRNTEWIETVEAGKNVLTGVDRKRIVQEVRSILRDPVRYRAMVEAPSPFVPGAAVRILDHLEELEACGHLAVRTSNFLEEGLPS